MIEKQYKLKNDIYTVTACTKEDIPSHIERVLSYWKATNTSISTQTKLLELAVEADTAYKVVNSDNEDMCVMYLLAESHTVAQCNLLWFVNKRVLAMLFYYLRFMTEYQTFTFTPHSKDFIPFRFLIPESSLRIFFTQGTPIEMSVYGSKSQILYEDHFLRYGIEEL